MWVGHVACKREKKRNVYMVLVEKSGEKRPLGKPTHRREANMKRDIKEV